MEWPRFGRVVLKPFSAGLSEAEWKGLYETFRDPEVAEWNGSSPLRSPFWLFKRFVLAEARRKDRVAFVILDEAQNTTVEQMKMFLTRLGFGSTVVVTGDKALNAALAVVWPVPPLATGNAVPE